MTTFIVGAGRGLEGADFIAEDQAPTLFYRNPDNSRYTCGGSLTQ